MRIQEITPQPNYTLRIVTHDGRVGLFDVTPYLQYEAFAALKNHDDFLHISNGGYFVEWACGADLSADTIEARWDELQTDTVHEHHHASLHAELATA
jgi:hypothetical protein